MIDTIKQKFNMSVPEPILAKWREGRLRDEIGNYHYHNYKNWVGKSSTYVIADYFPENYQGQSQFNIEISLPYVQYGHNILMLETDEQIRMAIEMAQAQIDSLEDFPKLQLADGVLIRLDICYNHFVKDHVADYLRHLSILEYPHREAPTTHLHESVLYKSNYISTTFYDKEEEVKNSEYKKLAEGILRQETTIRTRGLIAKKLKVEVPHLSDLIIANLQPVLEHDLRELKLDKSNFSMRDKAMEILKSEYKAKGYKLWGYLVDRQTRSKKDIADATGQSLRTLQDYEKAITKAGVSLVLTNDKVPLPALNINKGMQFSAQSPKCYSSDFQAKDVMEVENVSASS